jgi:hypothetical protein
MVVGFKRAPYGYQDNSFHLGRFQPVHLEASRKPGRNGSVAGSGLVSSSKQSALGLLLQILA